MMRQLLEMAGHTVVEATDGEQAVRVALKEKPTIILMDLSLPKLDGLAATREIRRHKGFRHVPILAISAHDGDESREAALAAGCNEYMTKPIDFDKLSTVVHRYLAKSH